MSAASKGCNEQSLAVIIAGCVVLVFVLLVATSGSRRTDGDRVVSFRNLHNVGDALMRAVEEHGTWPGRLSDLVPHYIPIDQIGVFYVRSASAQPLALPADWASNPVLVDQYGSYAYLAESNTQGVRAYERPGIWKSSAAYPDRLAVLFSDFHVELIESNKLQGLIAPPSTNRTATQARPIP